ncbi:MAG: hypothetical protein ABR951_00960 [Candidatus Aminicenantales bacterium]|jgi:hypothetical protein
MPNKVRTARLCLIVAGGLKIATAGLFLFILAVGSVFVGGSGERSGLLGNALLGALGIVLLLASAAAGAFDLLAASGVRRRTAWGRALGVIAGVLLVPLFPVGPVLGLFALTGLLGADGREWFSAGPVSA